MILEEIYGPYHPDMLVVYRNMAQTYDAMCTWINLNILLNYLHGGIFSFILILSPLLQHKSNFFRNSHSHSDLGGMHKFIRNFESFSMISFRRVLKNKNSLMVVLVYGCLFKPFIFSVSPLCRSGDNILVGKQNRSISLPLHALKFSNFSMNPL